MFPLNDTESSRYTGIPLITTLIIVVNVLIFLFAPHTYPFYQRYGTTPLLILQEQGGGAVTAVTHMFLHGSWMHLIGNMTAIWVFGRRVEDLTGPWRFAMFYLACGLVANIVSTITLARSDIPAIGASGALYGIMAAYLMLFPKGRIRVLFLFWFIPIFSYNWLNLIWILLSFIILLTILAFSPKNLIHNISTFYLPRIPAYLVILYFVLYEIPLALQVLVYNVESSIGHWAHLGGFFGGLLIFLFLRSDAYHRYRNELPL
jgi:membrane associated rhomboid family serine protease